MDKTLHKKLTEKHFYAHSAAFASAHSEDDLLSDLKQEIKILHEAAKDLLQPRPEAIANLLKMARSVS